MCYITQSSAKLAVLAISAEDGRVLFYGCLPTNSHVEDDQSSSLPIYQPFAQLGGIAADVQGRIKDFECLSIFTDGGIISHYILVTCGSDGVICIWHIAKDKLIDTRSANGSNGAAINQDKSSQTVDSDENQLTTENPNPAVHQIGKLLGSYKTSERITCLKAFVMEDAIDRPRDDDKAAELDFDANYHVDTPKSDSDIERAASEESNEE